MSKEISSGNRLIIIKLSIKLSSKLLLNEMYTLLCKLASTKFGIEYTCRKSQMEFDIYFVEVFIHFSGFELFMLAATRYMPYPDLRHSEPKSNFVSLFSPPGIKSSLGLSSSKQRQALGRCRTPADKSHTWHYTGFLFH